MIFWSINGINVQIMIMIIQIIITVFLIKDIVVRKRLQNKIDRLERIILNECSRST